LLNIVIADAEVETIPEKMIDDYAVRKYAKERRKPVSEVLLDSNFMHAAIERHFPGMSNRMGRPDIIYHCLQVCQESILNKKGELRVYVHTKHDYVIKIDRLTRLPKSYNRFVGLLEDLFRKERVGPPDRLLMEMTRSDAVSLLESLDTPKILLSPRGVQSSIRNLYPPDKRDVTVIIGGFSEGDFISPLYERYSSVSIFQEELTIWSVAMEVICEYERDFNLV